MDLVALQRALQAYVLTGHDAVTTQVAGERQSRAARLGIYAYAYGSRLRDALAQTFPALAQALGPKVFDGLAQGYARAQPSRFASVRDYGAALAQYVAGQLPGPRGRVAGELARWEWALAASFDAPDSAAAAVSELAALPPEQWPVLRLVPLPSMQLLALRGNAVAWWRWAQPAEQDSAAQRPRWREQRSRHWLVWRQDLAVRYRALSSTEAELVAAFRDGEDFASLCDRLARIRPVGSANRAAQLLHGWFSEGLVCSWSAGG